jgi:hypothetical protein
MREAAAELEPLFGATFELRFALRPGGAAVRVHGGPVAPRHAEARDPAAPWAVRAECGACAGWLLAAGEPTDAARARAVLQRAVERHAALRLQALAEAAAALTAELLERLTHRLRTDVSTLQTVAVGAATGAFSAAELAALPGELASTGAEAQRRLSAAREVMAALAPHHPAEPEPLLEVLAGELDAAGVDAALPEARGEEAMALVAGPGWGACARLLADACQGPEVSLAPHPDGWAVTVAAREIAHVALILVAAGGAARLHETAQGGPRAELVVPAAPSR